MQTRMARGRLLLMLALLAAAAVSSDQLRRLLALSSTETADDESGDQPRGPYPSIRTTTTTDERNDERARRRGEDGGVVAPTLSGGNATMINGQEEDDYEEDEDEDEDAEAEEEEWKPLPWSLPNRIRKTVPPQSSVEFMNELDGLKRSLNISLPWDDRSSLPTPIISLNLPKSATLTLYEYFKCGGLVSAHTFVNRSIRVGEWKPSLV